MRHRGCYFFRSSNLNRLISCPWILLTCFLTSRIALRRDRYVKRNFPKRFAQTRDTQNNYFGVWICRSVFYYFFFFIFHTFWRSISIVCLMLNGRKRTTEWKQNFFMIYFSVYSISDRIKWKFIFIQFYYIYREIKTHLIKNIQLVHENI